jgi:AAA+ superfamily predicted ATPase
MTLLNFIAITVSLAVGVGLGVVIAIACQRFPRRNSLRQMLRRHFRPLTEPQIEVQSRDYPYHVAVDAYRTLSSWIDGNCRIVSVVGLPITETFMSSVGISSLLADVEDNWYATSLAYDAIDVGNDDPESCIKHALWLLEHRSQKLAILWTSTTIHEGCGYKTVLRIDVARPQQATAHAKSAEVFELLNTAIQEAKSYRGKILSLEVSTSYSGQSGGIKVHKLRSVPREDVVLPETTVRMLERNVVRFIQQRQELAKLGMPTKKGLLLYGPPGTGKTFTIHYLIGALKGHTTLLVTAEQISLLDEYINLARLLQPSVLILEDVDLIGRHRDGMEVGRESLLNKLLNEMDGLRADAEIIFLLTTNRPEALEQALAARPGRVDQAIEFPLPDEVGRRKLVRLYASQAAISDDVVAHTARITHGVSASFIKELMRRSVQFNLECRTNGEMPQILQNDVDQAVEELVFLGGPLNRSLLGADGASSSDLDE